MENKIDEYNKRLRTLNGKDSESGTTAPESQTPNTDNYYDLARQQEYSTLFDKEVQLENAKQQALKYTQNQINAQGFGGTGYGSSLQAGTYNTYLNKVGNAQSEYNANIKQINAEENQAQLDADNDRFQSVTTMLTQASTQEQMDNLLADYGYGEIVDGKFTWGEKPEGMSDDDWYQMKYYYGLQSDALAEQIEATANANRPTYEYSGDIVYYGTDGKRYTDGKDNAWNQENATLQAGIKSGEIPSGSYVAMQNNSNHGTIYVYYENGKIYYVSKDEFNANSKNGAYYIYGTDRTIHNGTGDIGEWK